MRLGKDSQFLSDTTVNIERDDIQYFNRIIRAMNQYIDHNRTSLLADNCHRARSIRSFCCSIYYYYGVRNVHERCQLVDDVLAEKNLSNPNGKALKEFVDASCWQFQVPILERAIDDFPKVVKDIQKELDNMPTGWLGFLSKGMGLWGSDLWGLLSPLIDEAPQVTEKLKVLARRKNRSKAKNLYRNYSCPSRFGFS